MLCWATPAASSTGLVACRCLWRYSSSTFHLFELLEHADRAARRISGFDRKLRAFAVSFEFLILRISGLKYFHRNADDLAQRSVPKYRFCLRAIGTMVVIDVLDFMPEDSRQLIFGVHQLEQPRAQIHMPARQGVCVDEPFLGNVVKPVRQPPMGLRP